MRRFTVIAVILLATSIWISQPLLANPETYTIAIDVQVTVTGAGTAQDPYVAAFSYSQNTGQSTGGATKYLVTTTAVTQNRNTLSIEIFNDVFANIVYTFSLPGSWKLAPQNKLPIIHAVSLQWPANLTVERISNSQIKIADQGGAYESASFLFTITNGSTSLNSPDPMVIVKPDPTAD